jgi:hypothetical protein
MTPNPRTGLVTLTEVITGDLAGKFNEISLCNRHADFESGSASNSNSTSPWTTDIGHGTPDRSWLLARRQDLQEPDLTGTTKISQ